MATARVCTLASGSSGNALLVDLDGTAMLVDVGLEPRHLERALAAAEARIGDIAAVLVTHEHGDHVRGLGAFRDRRPDVPVYASVGTAAALARSGAACAGLCPVRPGTARAIGPARVLPFAVSHDASEPLGYRIDAGDFSIAIATDLGVAPLHVVAALRGCRVLVVEANHDEDMLWSGRYPTFLKRRISSARGHLSNRQTLGLVDAVAHDRLEHVVLAHLSRENNERHRAEDTVAPALAMVPTARMHTAMRVEPGEVLCIPYRPGGGAGPPGGAAIETGTPLPRQLSLFDPPGAAAR